MNTFKKNEKFALIIFGIIFFPILFLIFKSFFSETESLVYVIENLLVDYSYNTFKLIIITSIFSLIFGIIPAWYVSNFSFYGRGFIDVLLFLPLSIPTYIMAFTYSEILSFTGPLKIKTDLLQLEVLGIILSFSLFPYIYAVSRISFSLMGSKFINMGKNLGLSVYKSFFKIIIPLSKPAIFSGLFLVIMEVLNEYGAVKYFGVNTYTIGIFRTWNSMNDTGAAIQLSSILLFIVAFLFILEKKLNKKKLFSSLKNTKPIELIKSTGNQKLLIYLVCLIPIIFSFIIPVLFNISNAIDNFDKIDLINLFQLTFNSVSISLISAIIILVVSVYFLFNERFSNSKIYFYINQFISLGYSIPGAVIALAIIIYFTSIDKNIESISLLGNFYVYLFILIYAYLIRFMAVGKSPIKSGFEKLPKSYDFTAESLGLRRFSIFQKIYLPINKFSFVSALILVFIDLMKELPIILILRPFNFDTLATQTYEFAIEEMLPLSSIYSLVIIFVCSILLIIFKNIISRINVSRS